MEVRPSDWGPPPSRAVSAVLGESQDED
jgi:hypothetical protein